MSDKLTITLTSARPVAIQKSLWPIIAEGKMWEGTSEKQATIRWSLKIRQHHDGRSIVYGIKTFATTTPDVRCGKLLDSDSKEFLVATAKRSSMDLTRSLSQLRKS